MVRSIPLVSGPSSIPDISSPAGSGSGEFRDVLSQAVGAVESSGHSASLAVTQFLTGEGEEVHTAVLATERAQLTFDLFLQARNKVVSAYQEIMRMQV